MTRRWYSTEWGRPNVWWAAYGFGLAEGHGAIGNNQVKWLEPGDEAARFRTDPRYRSRRDDLMIVADRFGVGTAPKVLAEVSDAVSSWPDFAKQANVSPSEVSRIKEHHAILSR